MLTAYEVSQIRAAEETVLATGDPGRLMQRAAAGVAAAITRSLHPASGARVLVLTGPGNNGGDGLHAGARLARRGVQVFTCSLIGTPHPEGLAALLAAGGRQVDVARGLALVDEVDVVVDAVLGTGGRPGLSGIAAVFAAACRESEAAVVAVDLPSGMSADSVTDDDCFTADLTVVLGAYNICHLTQPARSRCGVLELVDLDLPLDDPALIAWQPEDVAARWPHPDVTSDKYSRGVVGLDAGSATYPGAGLLVASGAVGVGAGMVRFLGDDQVGQAVIDRWPNVVRAPGRVQAMVLGSGWGQRMDASLVIAQALGRDVPLVLDADALRQLPRDLPPTTVLTPHAGELARLLETARHAITDDPIAAVREAAERTGATVLLKGATQYVATPDGGPVRLAVPGPACTAQAGSGDVIAGACGALLATGAKPAHAALLAASIQAMTAERVGQCPPQDLAARFGETIAEFPAA